LAFLQLKREYSKKYDGKKEKKTQPGRNPLTFQKNAG
jgi:hypothetical protein